MPLTHSIFLGIAQGLTEFLPVSSSAHLELLPWLFGWEHFDGDAVREQAFDVALHLGTLLGAAFFLRSDIARYCKAVINACFRGASSNANAGSSNETRFSNDARVGIALALSAIPAAIVGVALEPVLVSLGEQPWVIASALLAGGWLLWWADRSASQKAARQKSTNQETERQVSDFSVRAAAYLGIAQACALVPGVSRSGATITMGRLLRFERSSAAMISFLMSLPIIAGAGLFRGLDLIGEDVPSADWVAMVVGLAAAAVTAWIALWLLMRLLAPAQGTPAHGTPTQDTSTQDTPTQDKSGQYPLSHRLFVGTAWYRSAFAILTAVVLVAGWR